MTFGSPTDVEFLSSPIVMSVTTESGSSARGRRLVGNGMATKKRTARTADELRPEYDISTLAGGVRGKYYETTDLVIQ